MPHCRWVVIPEDCFEELKSGSYNPSAPTLSDKTEIEKDTRTRTEQSPQNNTAVEKTEKSDWTKHVPPVYRSEAQEFLNKLIRAGNFEFLDSGHVVLNGKATDYHVSDLLRTAFVPYNKSPFPLDVQEWKREKGITEFRNPLVKIPPKWQSMYTLRRSTRKKQISPKKVS